MVLNGKVLCQHLPETIKKRNSYLLAKKNNEIDYDIKNMLCECVCGRANF